MQLDSSRKWGWGEKHRSMHSRDTNYVALLSRMANQFWTEARTSGGSSRRSSCIVHCASLDKTVSKHRIGLSWALCTTLYNISMINSIQWLLCSTYSLSFLSDPTHFHPDNALMHFTLFLRQPPFSRDLQFERDAAARLLSWLGLWCKLRYS